MTVADIMAEIILIIAITTTALILVIVLLGWLLITLKRENAGHTKALLALHKARSLAEFNATERELKMSADDHARMLELENDLARDAVELARDRDTGVPIT